MRQPSSNSRDSSASKARTVANESDPLLSTSNQQQSGGSIRSRRNKSPTVSINQHFGSVDYTPRSQQQRQGQMNTALASSDNDASSHHHQTSYEYMKDGQSSLPHHSVGGNASQSSGSHGGSSSAQTYPGLGYVPRIRQQYQDHQSDDASHSTAGGPLLEIPEEIYAVRKAALTVLKPLTKTWVRRLNSR